MSSVSSVVGDYILDRREHVGVLGALHGPDAVEPPAAPRHRSPRRDAPSDGNAAGSRSGPGAAISAPAIAGRSTIGERQHWTGSVRRRRCPRRRTRPERPGTRLPVSPSAVPAARHPPRVAAANAARAEIELSGVRWWTAARIVAHGSRLVTGASDPNARATPWDASSANGLRRCARSIPRRRAYMPSRPPHSASKLGCMLAITPHPPSFAACSAVTISRCSRRWPHRATAGHAEFVDHVLEGATTLPTAASPMTWNPAVTPASVQARRCASTVSLSR